MAKTNNAVIASTGLTCSVLTDPAVGSSSSGSVAFTDGDTATDTYVSVGTSPTPLNADILGGGLLRVVNPLANGVSVSILCATTPMGPILPGTSVLLPLASGTVYNATVVSSTYNVGVTVVECDANA